MGFATTARSSTTTPDLIFVPVPKVTSRVFDVWDTDGNSLWYDSAINSTGHRLMAGRWGGDGYLYVVYAATGSVDTAIYLAKYSTNGTVAYRVNFGTYCHDRSKADLSVLDSLVYVWIGRSSSASSVAGGLYRFNKRTGAKADTAAWKLWSSNETPIFFNNATTIHAEGGKVFQYGFTSDVPVTGDFYNYMLSHSVSGTAVLRFIPDQFSTSMHFVTGSDGSIYTLNFTGGSSKTSISKFSSGGVHAWTRLGEITISANGSNGRLAFSDASQTYLRCFYGSSVNSSGAWTGGCFVADLNKSTGAVVARRLSTPAQDAVMLSDGSWITMRYEYIATPRWRIQRYSSDLSTLLWDTGLYGSIAFFSSSDLCIVRLSVS